MVFMKCREEAESNLDKRMHDERPEKLHISYIMYEYSECCASTIEHH
jgi:hypothetical protein